MKKLITTLLTVLLTSQLYSSNLAITNGDFSNLTGLGDQGGSWYSGIPTGWNGVNTFYTIYNLGGNYIANLSQLSSPNPWSPFTQNIGLLDVDSDVTLYFDILGPFNPNPSSVGIAIYGVGNTGNQGILYNNIFNDGLNQSLLVENIAAGTELQIAFWATGGVPALDNVYVVSAAVIPEPTVLDLVTLPAKLTSYCVGVISRNIYTGGLNSGNFNSLTILY